MTEIRSYDLNSEDRIIQVSGDWDRFALANDGPRAQSPLVLGRPLWQFMDGFEIKSFINALFFAVRTSGHPLSLPYRCDSPDTPRLFSMTIRPFEAHGLSVTHVSLPLPHGHLSPGKLSQAPVTPERGCANCCAVLVAGNWVDPFSLSPHPEAPETAVICPHCRSVAVDAVSALSGRARIPAPPPH